MFSLGQWLLPLIYLPRALLFAWIIDRAKMDFVADNYAF